LSAPLQLLSRLTASWRNNSSTSAYT